MFNWQSRTQSTKQWTIRKSKVSSTQCRLAAVLRCLVCDSGEAEVEEEEEVEMDIQGFSFPTLQSVMP